LLSFSMMISKVNYPKNVQLQQPRPWHLPPDDLILLMQS